MEMNVDHMIIDYLISSGLRRTVAYTDKKFLIQYSPGNYRFATKLEIGIIY